MPAFCLISYNYDGSYSVLMKKEHIDSVMTDIEYIPSSLLEIVQKDARAQGYVIEPMIYYGLH